MSIHESHEQPEELSTFIESSTHLHQINRQVVTFASSYSNHIIANVYHQISNGEIQIHQPVQNINEFLDCLKITDEERKVQEEKMKRQIIQQQLRFLDDQIKHRNNPERQQLNIEFHSDRILSKQEHLQLMNKIIKEKKQRDQHHQQYLRKRDLDLEEQQETQRKHKELQQKEENRERKREIQQKLKRNKEQKQKQLSLNKELNKKLFEMKKKTSLYEKLEQRYQSEVVIPSLEEKKKKLKDIRQFKHNFSIDEIKAHEKEYIKHKIEGLAANKEKQKEKWVYHPPARTEKLNQLLQQERIQEKKKLEEKKRLNDQRFVRVQNFTALLKEKYAPKIDEMKKNEIINRLNKEMSTEKLYKENKQIDRKMIGIRYLEEVRKMKKKQKQQKTHPESERFEIQIKSKDRNKTSASIQYSKKERLTIGEIKKKNLDQILKSNEFSQSEKIKKIQDETERMNDLVKMKEDILKVEFNQKINEQAVGLLLCSIHAKINLIDIYGN